MKHWLPLALCALLTWITPAAGEDSAAFDQANKLYEEGRYLEAIEAYQQMATNNNTVALHFNLGNAWFKSGQIGEAIAEYRLAETLSPRDPDVRANLRFARARVEGPAYRPGWFQQQADALTAREWTAVTTISIWGFLGLLTACQLRPNWTSRLRAWTVASGAVATLLLAATIWISKSHAETQLAVVVQRETVMRRGPFEESQSALTLKNGSELRVLDRKNGWLQVTPDGRQSGWIPDEAVRIVPA